VKRLVVAVFAAAATAVTFTPSAALGGLIVNQCAVQPPPTGPAPSFDATTLRLEGIVARLGLRRLEATLGAQDGGAVLADHGHLFVLGLAPGALSVADAQQAVDTALDEDLSSADAAFATPLFQVESASYPEAKFDADVPALFSQLEKVVSNPGAVTVGITSPLLYGFSAPVQIIFVELNALATDADGSYVKQMVIGTLLGSWRRW
jgi:hypothetical protein